MKKNIKNLKLATILSFIMFVVYTLVVKFVLVSPIGPNNTSVGLAPLNKAVDDILGLNMDLYNFTDIFLYISILLALCLLCIGIRQAYISKSISKIDNGIIWTVIFYLLVIAVYFVFELIKINYRPVIIEGELEYSYPSSHTMIVLCILGPMIIQVNRLIKDKKICKIIDFICILMMIFTVIGRLLSGVHWFTDIVGAVLISIFMVFMYITVLTKIDNNKIV